MPVMVAEALAVSDEDRAGLEVMARSTSLAHRKVVQARALLLAADGVANNEIARRCDTTADAVRRWRARFAEEGVAGVGVIAPGRGRKPEIDQRVVHPGCSVSRSSSWSSPDSLDVPLIFGHSAI